MQTTHHNPTFDRPPANVPDESFWYAKLAARLYSGEHARELVKGVIDNPGGIVHGTVAVDIEAAGLGAASFTVRCITAAWHMTNEAGGMDVHAVVLDPRRDVDRALAHGLMAAARWLVFHNAAYDIPPLYALGVITDEGINKVIDTVVYARMAYPDRQVSKGLESLAARSDLLGLDAGGESMDKAFTTRGYRTKAAGFADADIDMPIYRIGAMADTVVTLRLGPALYGATVNWLTSGPFQGPTVPDTARANELIDREQTVNRVMLRRSAKGIAVDVDYLELYRGETQENRDSAAALLRNEISDEAPGRGDLLVAYLDKVGQLPSTWSRTPTGKLKADKAALASLDHPLVKAHRDVADTDHVLDYLTKVGEFSALTGRVHPQVNILGASATGRMAYTLPEAQQFPAEARPILVPDNPGEGKGWTSIDWSAIEPVTMANAAGDVEFLHGFNNNGADLYAPIVEYAGVDRKTAKVVVLGAMYGQGIKLLATNLGVSEDEARTIQSRVFGAMPKTAALLDNIRYTAESYKCIMTMDGRRLPVPTDPTGKTMAYKGTNYFCQGTAYSVLSEAIVAIERAGLGDHIQLAMHDELIVNTVAADEVKRIMSTPPTWMEQFCGHRVVLRTDSNPLPFHWAYV